MATLVRAIEAAEPTDDRSLRSLTAQICGPVAVGPAIIDVEVLRRGSGVSTIAARLLQGDELLSYAVGMLGRARADRPARSYIEAPALPPWRDVPPMPSEVLSSAPGFAREFEFRNVGVMPFQGATSATAAGWVRPRRPGPLRDAAYLAALIDVYWPTIYSVMPAPRPIGTIAFTLDIAGTLEGLNPEAPLFSRSFSVSEREGYVVEVRELWGEDGRLLAVNHQTVAIIR